METEPPITMQEAVAFFEEICTRRHAILQSEATKEPIKLLLNGQNIDNIDKFININNKNKGADLKPLDHSTVTFTYKNEKIIPIRLQMNEGELSNVSSMLTDDQKAMIPFVYVYWFGLSEHVIITLQNLIELNKTNNSSHNITVELNEWFPSTTIAEYYVNYIACPHPRRFGIPVDVDFKTATKRIISMIENLCLLYTYYVDEIYSAERKWKPEFSFYVCEKILNDICVNMKKYLDRAIKAKWDEDKVNNIICYIMSRLKDCCDFVTGQKNTYIARNAADTRWEVKTNFYAIESVMKFLKSVFGDIFFYVSHAGKRAKNNGDDKKEDNLKLVNFLLEARKKTVVENPAYKKSKTNPALGDSYTKDIYTLKSLLEIYSKQKIQMQSNALKRKRNVVDSDDSDGETQNVSTKKRAIWKGRTKDDMIADTLAKYQDSSEEELMEELTAQNPEEASVLKLKQPVIKYKEGEQPARNTRSRGGPVFTVKQSNALIDQAEPDSEDSNFEERFAEDIGSRDTGEDDDDDDDDGEVQYNGNRMIEGRTSTTGPATGSRKRTRADDDEDYYKNNNNNNGNEEGEKGSGEKQPDEKERPAIQETLLLDMDPNEIIGQEKIVNLIFSVFGLAQKYKSIMPQSKGILLYGPPGTGKTMIAKIVANLLNTLQIKPHFFAVSAASILSAWLGQSEKQIKAIFEHANEVAKNDTETFSKLLETQSDPTIRKSKRARVMKEVENQVPIAPIFDSSISVLFMDEIEGLARKRGGGENDENTRNIINTLIATMDGIIPLPFVSVIGATNIPTDMDSAILRRFTDHLFIDLPRDEARELQILMYIYKYIINDKSRRIKFKSSSLNGKLKEARVYLKDIFDVIAKYVEEVNKFFQQRGTDIRFKPVTLEFIEKVVVPKLGRSKLYDLDRDSKVRNRNKDPASRNRSPMNSMDEDDELSYSSDTTGTKTEMRKVIEEHFRDAKMNSSPMATSYLGYTPSDVTQMLNRTFNNASRMLLSCPVPLDYLENMPLALKNIEYNMPSISAATAARQLVVSSRTDPKFPNDLRDQFKYAFLAPYRIYIETARNLWPKYADEYDEGEEVIEDIYDSDDTMNGSDIKKKSPILGPEEFAQMSAEISYESTNKDLRNLLITQEAFLDAIEDIKPSLDLETYYKLVVYYNSSKKMK